MSPWLPHFDRGILAYSEAGIYESFHVRGYEVQAPRQRFYQRPDLSEGNVALTVRQLTAAFALLPIVLEGDRPGNEILSPLSVVILGGLLTSTFLNLVVVPAGYAALNSLREAPDAQPSPRVEDSRP